MKKNSGFLRDIESEIERLTQSLIRSLKVHDRPRWTQVISERGLSQAINKIIATHWANGAFISPTALSIIERQAAFKSIAQYSRQKRVEILEKLKAVSKNPTEANKKILVKNAITAQKLLAAWLSALYLYQDQMQLKKAVKKRKRLSAQREREKERKLKELAEREITPPEAPDATLIPTNAFSAPAPAPIYVHDFELPKHLHVLGLKLGADHLEIERAFLTLKEEFLAKAHPTIEEQKQFHSISQSVEILTKVDNLRLTHLSRVTETEIKELADNLRVEMPELLSKGATLSEIKAGIIESNLQQNSERPSPIENFQMQKMMLTLEKLENQFGSNTQQLINLRQFLPPSLEATSRFSQAPKLTMH